MIFFVFHGCCYNNSRYDRYYYTNKHGRTQWDFPTIKEADATATEKSEETVGMLSFRSNYVKKEMSNL